MSKAMKIAFAVSVALNLFLLGAVAAGFLVGQRAIRDRVDRMPLFVAARELPEAEQQRLREGLRSAAVSARRDFRDAREARRRAVELAGADRYDKAAVLKALDRARAAELRGRAKLETGMAEAFEGLDAEARKTLAPSLVRPPRGRHKVRFRDGEPPAEAAPPKAD